MVNIKQKLEQGWIHFRTVIEILGKPKEHVEKTIKIYIEKIKKEKDLIIIEEHLAEIKKQETGAQEKGLLKELWSTFAELEILAKNPLTITYFCFDYMPSSIEIIEPQNLTFTASEASGFFNDLQARLHQLDMIAKQMKSQTLHLHQNIHNLLKNYLTVLLSKGELTSEQISKFTGLDPDTIEDFLDTLIDQKKVEMHGEKYKLILKKWMKKTR